MAGGVEVVGGDKAIATLARLRQSAENLQPAFAEMAPLIIQEFTSNFDSQGTLLDAKWKPRVRSYPWPILQKTGKLKASWNAKPESRDLTIKNTADYATYQHFGSTRLPARKLVGKSDQIIKIALNFITKFLKEFI